VRNPDAQQPYTVSKVTLPFDGRRVASLRRIRGRGKNASANAVWCRQVSPLIRFAAGRVEKTGAWPHGGADGQVRLRALHASGFRVSGPALRNQPSFIALMNRDY